MTIGQKIKKYRESFGWSQDELAKKLGVSVSTVGMIETDKRNIKDKIKFDICNLFNITIAELMSNNETDFELLKNKIIGVFVKNHTNKTKFNDSINETINIINEQKYLIKGYSKNIETREIISNIMHFFSKYSTSKNIIADEDITIQKYKEQLISMLKSINYNELDFNNLITIYPQTLMGTQIEETIKKNFYKNTKEYIGIKISNDRMSPKYEKGNVAIIEKSSNFYNYQDICFKNKMVYELGRIFIQNDIVIIKYLNNSYDIESFDLNTFKKMYIGTVISVQI